jgi:hypothetical protein
MSLAGSLVKVFMHKVPWETSDHATDGGMADIPLSELLSVAHPWYCKRLFDPTRLLGIEEASLEIICASL